MGICQCILAWRPRDTHTKMMLTEGARGMENRKHSIWEEPGKEAVPTGARQSKVGDKGTDCKERIGELNW